MEENQSIEDSELIGQAGEDGKFVGREIVHDEARVLQAGLLVEVAAHETTHVRGAVGILSGGDAAEDLEVGRGEVVVGVGIGVSLSQWNA